MNTENKLPNEWSVITRKMNGQDARMQYFPSFAKAYEFYLIQCDNKNIESVEQTTGAEMNLTSGGVGYDYRIELEEVFE